MISSTMGTWVLCPPTALWQPHLPENPSPALCRGVEGREGSVEVGELRKEGAELRLWDGDRGMSCCSKDPAARQGQRVAAEVLSVAAVSPAKLPQPHIPWAL